jgi:glycosyltransferase involved in cell wall biosynthesis
MRILLITPFSPFSPASGAEQRSALLHEGLARLGRVDVVRLEPGPRTRALEPADRRIRAHVQWKARPFGIDGYAANGTVTRLVAGAVDLGAYDVIVARNLTPVSRLALPPAPPVIVDLDDACYRFDPILGFGRAMLARRMKAWFKQSAMASAMTRYRAFFFVSGQDRDRYAPGAAAVLPNIPYALPQRIDPSSPDGPILFVGSLWYGPNREGVARFLERTWPAVRHARPDAQLVLAGAAPEADRARWSGAPGVSAPGFVPDLAAAYRDAALVVAPVWSGGGSNIKILEAMAHARACATTRFCMRPFADACDPARDLSVAASDAELAANIVRLLGDPAEREARARRGAELVRERFDRDTFFERIAGLLRGTVHLETA